MTGLKAIKKLKNDHNLEDTWRLKHPTKTFFTNHDKNYTRKSRIDRIYKSKDITMKSIQILPFQHSDHDVVQIKIIQKQQKRRPGYWKLNTSILKHDNYKNTIKKFRQDWQNQKQDYDTITQWWDVGKLYIKMILIRYSTLLNQNIKKAQEEATNKILLEKQKEIPNLNKIKELYNQLEDIQNYKKQGTIIRSKEKLILEQEQPNKYFFEQEKSKQKKKTIPNLK